MIFFTFSSSIVSWDIGRVVEYVAPDLEKSERKKLIVNEDYAGECQLHLWTQKM